MRFALVTVPSNKIIAFGGDTSIEWAYGHSIMTRKIVAQTLTHMIHEGYFTIEEAITIAKKLLRTNALDLYMIEKKNENWVKRSMRKD